MKVKQIRLAPPLLDNAPTLLVREVQSHARDLGTMCVVSVIYSDRIEACPCQRRRQSRRPRAKLESDAPRSRGTSPLVLLASKVLLLVGVELPVNLLGERGHPPLANLPFPQGHPLGNLCRDRTWDTPMPRARLLEHPPGNTSRGRTPPLRSRRRELGPRATGTPPAALTS